MSYSNNINLSYWCAEQLVHANCGYSPNSSGSRYLNKLLNDKSLTFEADDKKMFVYLLYVAKHRGLRQIFESMMTVFESNLKEIETDDYVEAFTYIYKNVEAGKLTSDFQEVVLRLMPIIGDRDDKSTIETSLILMGMNVFKTETDLNAERKQQTFDSLSSTILTKNYVQYYSNAIIDKFEIYDTNACNRTYGSIPCGRNKNLYKENYSGFLMYATVYSSEHSSAVNVYEIPQWIEKDLKAKNVSTENLIDFIKTFGNKLNTVDKTVTLSTIKTLTNSWYISHNSKDFIGKYFDIVAMLTKSSVAEELKPYIKEQLVNIKNTFLYNVMEGGDIAINRYMEVVASDKNSELYKEITTNKNLNDTLIRHLRKGKHLVKKSGWQYREEHCIAELYNIRKTIDSINDILTFCGEQTIINIA